ncbi:hypothetical protein D3C86_1870870 [compost metagenome]
MTSACKTHERHEHQHGQNCGHLKVQWADETGYLHDGHLHRQHGEHWDESSIPVSARNPDTCQQVACAVHAEDQPMVPHGDHMDRVVNGRLHHEHAGHCDDHGPVQVLG